MTKELKNKIIFTALILIIIQLISNIPAYGINKEVVSTFLNSETGSALSFFSMFSGNAFYQMSMFVLGISPYISASIILQLLRAAIPSFDELAKDGKAGEKLYKRLNYIAAEILAIFQTIPIVIGFGNYGLLIENTTKYKIIISILIILGSTILMFLGNLIDKKGIGQGISLILLINILSRIPNDITTIINKFIINKPIWSQILTIFITFIIIIAIIIIVLYLQDGERRIKTQYASQLKGQKALKSNKSNYIPLKVNISNVMPIIFTTSVFQCYILITTFLNVSIDSIFGKISNLFNTSNWFNIDNPINTLGYIIYIALIFLFGFFYSEVAFDTEKITKNLKESDGVIIGIRPGKETEQYLNKELKKTTTIGCIGLIIVATIPVLISAIFNIPNLAFGGTSIIIIVGVILDTYKAIKSEKLEQSNDSFLF